MGLLSGDESTRAVWYLCVGSAVMLVIYIMLCIVCFNLLCRGCEIRFLFSVVLSIQQTVVSLFIMLAIGAGSKGQGAYAQLSQLS